MTPEARITTSIIRALRKRKAGGHCLFFVKLHGGPMQKAGLPDLLVVYKGRAYFFEVKRPGGKATPLQEHTLAELWVAGAVACVVNSADEVLGALSDLEREVTRVEA
jgi:hypothetical protein